MSNVEMDLAAKVARALGRSEVRLVRVPAGASNAAYLVQEADGKDADEKAFAFLRAAGTDATDEAINPARGLGHEGELLRKAHALGFTVPKVLAIFSDPDAVLMELVPGTSRPDAAASEAVAADLMGELARLHTIPPADLGLEAEATLGEAVKQDLDHWISIARARRVTDSPLARLGIRMLEHTMPGGSEPPSTLHGDVGPGNFMVHEGKLSAILDWEIAHAGDVHEDLAWLWARGAHTDFGKPSDRVAEYERAAGRKLDPARLKWQIASVTWKCVVGLRGRLNLTAEDPALFTIYISTLTYEALLGAALASLAGFKLDLLGEEPMSQPTAQSRLAARAAANGGADTPKETALIIRHLADYERQAAWRAARLAEDARRELGVEPAGLGALVDSAQPAQFSALVRVLGGHAGRIVRSLPNAERRVRRALGIGLGG